MLSCFLYLTRTTLPSLEFFDFRVLIMKNFCLFQCPCLTRIVLAFKNSLSELSGKWCSHAMGLLWVFIIFSSYAEIKCMLGLWQIMVCCNIILVFGDVCSFTQISWSKWSENCPLQWVTAVCYGQADAVAAAAGACPWAHLFFWVSVQEQWLSCSSEGFPTGLSQAIIPSKKRLRSWISIFWLEKRNCFYSL